MGQSEIDKLLASLNATFEAAVAREEDEAASDLAFSLLQGLDFVETLRRGHGATLRASGGATLSVVEVGSDYVVARGPSTVLVPSLHAIIVRSAVGAPPRVVEGTLVEALRRMARTHRTVEVRTQDGTFTGRLVKAGPDHVVVQAREANVLIGLGALRAVSVARGEGSEDAF